MIYYLSFCYLSYILPHEYDSNTCLMELLDFCATIFVSLVGLCSSENFTITRNATDNLDRFVVPPSWCGRYENKTVMCQEYNARPVTNVECTCRCRNEAATFGFFNNVWRCTKNKVVREISDCTNLTLAHEIDQNAVVKVLRDSESVNLTEALYDWPIVNRSSQLTCDSTYKDFENKKEFKFDNKPHIGTPSTFIFYKFTRLEGPSALQGHVIRIVYIYYLRKETLPACFMVKMEGSVTCPAPDLPSSITLTISPQKTATKPSTFQPQSSTRHPLTSITTRTTPIKPSPSTTPIKPSPSTTPIKPSPSTTPIKPSPSTTSTTPGVHDRGGRVQHQGRDESGMAAIISGVVAAIVVLLVLAIIAALWYRRRRLNDTAEERSDQPRASDGVFNFAITHDENNYALPIPQERHKRMPIESVYNEPYSDTRNLLTLQNLQRGEAQSTPDVEGPIYSAIEEPNNKGSHDDQPGVAPAYGVLEGMYSEGAQNPQPVEGPVYGVLEGPNSDELDSIYNRPLDVIDSDHDGAEGVNDEQSKKGPVYGVLEGPDSEQLNSVYHSPLDVIESNPRASGVYNDLVNPANPVYEPLRKDE
ncbi:uncharacterized protein LOC116620361 [Nematostella vectensis]|uniref:uncharacterized protein LOC116620361 n=1 Tax=Nematostella vectensis TaxID=45351 RepID=UPI0013903FC7|nr:uncharacterized protein LOC116620361 [Nematostella vectensis]